MTAPDPRDHGYAPALWIPGGQHFLAPDGVRVVSMEQAVAELDAQADREDSET